MKSNSVGSFFTELRRKFFKWRTNREIFERLFPHLNGETNFGYSFANDEQMNAQTEALELQATLDSLESQIRKMPKGYGKCFRHIMHRDLRERLRMYEQVARPRVHPTTVDPRFVATRA